MAHPVVHFEVSGKDLDKLNGFYAELFGWKTQKVPGEMPYAMVEKEDGGIGGGIGQAPDGNGHVTFYVGTDDAGDAGQGRAARRQDDPAGDRIAAGHDRAFRRSGGPRRRARQGDVAR
jgi:predicted enzyme related to lactoylglutathione lyase